MKVKFYKGPLHGKTRQIRESDLVGGSIDIQYYTYGKDKVAITTGLPWQVNLGHIDTVKYSVHVMSGTINGAKFSGPSVHPDGSIFLVHNP